MAELDGNENLWLHQTPEYLKPFLDSLPEPFHWRMPEIYNWITRSRKRGGKAAEDAYTDVNDHLVCVLA